MDATTFRFITGLATQHSITMKMMDVVTAYLYGGLDKVIYMRVPDGMTFDPTKFSKPCVKLIKSLYGLKQSGRMWFQRLTKYLLKCGFQTNEICPCIFIKRKGDSFVLIAIYVDDLNIIGTDDACQEAATTLELEFEMKDLGETSFCLGIQLTKVVGGRIMHQTTYTQKLLLKFKMNDCKPVKTPMQGRNLTPSEDAFRPAEEGEEILNEDYPYLSAIGGLMYLANQTRPDIAFAVNLLARHSNRPTSRHWEGVKHILRYLKGTEDMGLFFQNKDT
jgi:hypothetical protein